MAEKPDIKRRRKRVVVVIVAAAAFAATAVWALRQGGGKMTEPLDDSIKYMLANPPTCIKSLTTAADADLRKRLVANYGTHSTVFGVQCQCGKNLFGITGKDVGTGYQGVAGPITVQCTDCAQEAILFDPAKHGYEGVTGEAGYSDHSALPDRKLACPTCSKASFEIAVAFQYSGDEAETITEFDLSVRPEELFGWMAAQGRCGSCGADFEVASIECQ